MNLAEKLVMRPIGALVPGEHHNLNLAALKAALQGPSVIARMSGIGAEPPR